METNDVLPVSALEAHLGYWLRLVSNHVSAGFARAIQTRGLSAAEWVALRHLYDRGRAAPAELAGLTGMTRGAITKVLDKLEAKGLISRAAREDDGRGKSLRLTARGARLLPRLAALADRNDQEYFGCLDAAEQARLKSILEKLARFHQWKDAPVD